MSLETNGAPHVLYYAGHEASSSAGSQLIHTYRRGKQWISEAIPGVMNDTNGNNAAICAIGSDGRMHCLYTDSTHHVVYGVWDGTELVNQTMPGEYLILWPA